MKKVLSLLLCGVMLIASCISVDLSALANEVNYVTVNVTPQNNADASKVIQDALDSAMENAAPDKPYKVVVAPGSYILSNHLMLYSNTYLECTGATFKKGYTEGTMLTIGTNKIPATGNNYYKNITVNGGTFDGDGDGKKKTGSIFKFSHAQNVVITNATFKDCCDAHHIGFAGCKDVLISGCTFTGHYYSSSSVDNNMEAVQLDILEESHFPAQNPVSYDATMNENITVTGCYFDKVNRGVGCHSAFTGKYMHNIDISNNTFVDVDGYAIQTSNFIGAKIYNNVITNCGSGIYYRSMNPEYANLYALGSTAQSDTYSEIRNNTITVTQTADKNFRQFGYGIRVYGEYVSEDKKIDGGKLKAGDYRAYNIAVSDNNITLDTNANGIWLFGACNSSVNNNSVTYVNNPSVKQDSTGIRIDTAENIQVDGNSVNANHVTYVNNAILTGNSTVSINNNAVTMAKQNGINISSKSTASVGANTITNSGQCGILCYDSSKITTNANNISKSKKHGIFIVDSKSSNKLSNDIIDSSSKSGVALQNAKASISGVTTQKSKISGIYLTQKSNASINGCTVDSSTKDGVQIINKSTAALKNNTITNSGQCGILCHGSSKITTKSNKISKNKKHGIFIVDSQKNNKLNSDIIQNNSNYGVDIQNSKAAVSSVTAQKNKLNGIFLTQKSDVQINGCTVSSNSKDGIYVTQGSKTAIKSATVSSNKGNGIYFTNSAKGSVKSSTVKKNKKCGIYLTKKVGKITFSKVKYSANKGGKLKK